MHTTNSSPTEILTRRFTSAVITPEEEARLETQTPSSDTPTRCRWLKMATSDLDRSGDILRMSGIVTTNFLKNPQFLWQHGLSGALVNTIGTVRRIVTTSKALYVLAEYAAEDVSALAEQIYRMDLAGLLPANSIGFRPIEWEENDHGGRTFLSWELIECSKVELPMNPNAIDDGEPNLRRALTVNEASLWLAP